MSGHDMMSDASWDGAWNWEMERPAMWAKRWDNIPLGLFWLGLLVGGPLMRFGAFGPQSFLHRRPVKAARCGLATTLHLEWATSLTTKELTLLVLFAISVITKFVFYYTWFLNVGRPQPAGRALSHTLGLLMGMTFIMPHRSTVWLWITGMPVERAAAFHTCCAQTFYWACCLKLVFMLTGYAGTDLGAGHLFSSEMDSNTRMHPSFIGDYPVVPYLGVSMWISFTLLFITSMDYVRRGMWDWFFALHLQLVLVTMVLALLHSPGAAVSWFGVPFAFLVVDQGIRIADKSCKKSSVLAFESLGDDACRAVLRRSDSFKFTAGQYVFLTFSGVKSPGPPTSGFETDHPYSICSAPGDGSNFEVVIKGMGAGSWSQSMCDLAKSAPDVSALKVQISGPHGSLQVQLPFFKHVVLFAGGVGVTPMLSIFFDLLSKHDSGESEVRKVILIWAVRDATQKTWFEQAWSALPGSKGATEGIFQVRQYITSKVTNNPIEQRRLSSDLSSEDGGDAVVALSVRSGRPSVPETLHEMKQLFTEDSGENPGVAVLACGPGGLMDEVHDQTFVAQSPECRFSLHKETFIL
jgi:ferredoxin-NADP reductase